MLAEDLDESADDVGKMRLAVFGEDGVGYSSGSENSWRETKGLPDERTGKKVKMEQQKMVEVLAYFDLFLLA